MRYIKVLQGIGTYAASLMKKKYDFGEKESSM